MGAEHSQQRVESDGNAIYEGCHGLTGNVYNSGQLAKTTGGASNAAVMPNNNNRRNIIRSQNNRSYAGGVPNSSIVLVSKQIISATASPTGSEISRPPSPPLSVCSDLPYISYTDRPIGDSPKIRNKPIQQLSTSHIPTRNSHPSGSKPKRPQSTASSHSIVIVKPGARDELNMDPDLSRLQSIPQFLPVLRESITSATFTRDAEILERLHSQHLLNICSRMQTHLNLCATHIAKEQNHLVERTKMVSNSITTLFASFVDMQKTYAAYAEQFVKIRSVSQQLSRCNSLLHENIASLEAINNFLDVEDRLEPFVWRTDDKKLRGVAEGAVGSNSAWRL